MIRNTPKDITTDGTEVIESSILIDSVSRIQ